MGAGMGKGGGVVFAGDGRCATPSGVTVTKESSERSAEMSDRAAGGVEVDVGVGWLLWWGGRMGRGRGVRRTSIGAGTREGEIYTRRGVWGYG